MTEQDEVRRLVVNAITSAAITDQDSERRRLQTSHFPYGQRDGHYYGYHNYPYPPYPEEQKFIGIIPWILEMVLKILKFCAIGIMLLSSCITMYGLFYWAVMPGSYASRPLFFDYTGTVAYPHQNVTSTLYTATMVTTAANTGDNNSQNAQVATTSALPSHVTPMPAECPTYTPWASVDLFAIEQAVSWGETIYSDLIPPPTIQNRILQPKQAYYVEVHLTLPESAWNQQLGMFGVAVDLVSHPDQNGTAIKLASSVRPGRLPYESNWLAVVRKLVWVVPLVFGGMQESRVIVITSFRHMLESQEYPLRHIVTRLVAQSSLLHQQRPEHSTMPPVEVVGGEVRIGKELNWWQQILKDWFYTCYSVGTILLFGAHIGAWIIFQYCRGENHDDCDSPYFDPSCDFSQHDDDDFETIDAQSYDCFDDGEAQSFDNTPRHENDDCGGDGNSNDDSENWEECQPVGRKEEELEGTRLQSNDANSTGPTAGIGSHSGRTESRHRQPGHGEESAMNRDSRGRMLPNTTDRISDPTTPIRPTKVTSSRIKRRKAERRLRNTDDIEAIAATSVTECSPSSMNHLPSSRRSLSEDRKAPGKGYSEVYGKDGVERLDERQGLSTENKRQKRPQRNVGNAEYKSLVSQDGTGQEDCFFDCAESPTAVAASEMSVPHKKRSFVEEVSGGITSNAASPLTCLDKNMGDATNADCCSDKKNATDQDNGCFDPLDSKAGSPSIDSKNNTQELDGLKISKPCHADEKGMAQEAGDTAMKDFATATPPKGFSNEAKEKVELGHGPQNAIFQVPEAQILDSFVNDLINPFVR